MVRAALARLLLLLPLGWGPAGCGEPCDPEVDRPYCDGDVVVHCPPPGVDQLVGANRWRRRECLPEQSCLETPEGYVLCALSAEPEPLCVEGRSAVCDGDVARLLCQVGYVTWRDECLACSEVGTWAECEGRPGQPCSWNADCVSWSCSPEGRCR